MAVVLKCLIQSKVPNTIGSKTTMEANLRSLQAEDLADFNALVLAHQDRLYNQAYFLLGDHPAAEDAPQEAFIIAYNKFHSYRGGSLVGRLLTIVTNLCQDEIRHRKRRPILPLGPVDGNGEELESPKWLADPAKSPEEAVERGDVRAAIQTGINCLPPKYRSALVLVDIQRLHYAEAAEVMGCTVGTMKSRLARARWLLRINLNNCTNLHNSRKFKCGLLPDQTVLQSELGRIRDMNLQLISVYRIVSDGQKNKYEVKDVNHDE